MSRPRTVLVAARALTLASLVLVVGCGDSDRPARAVMGAGADRFPSKSLRDWVSYADHVAAFTVVAEEEVPPSQAELSRGEGLVGREVTLRVDQALWSAPNAPKLPETVKMRALGWILQDGRRLPMTTADAPRVTVGERYLAPLVQVEGGSGALDWWPLTVGSQLPLTNSRTRPSGGEGDWDSPVRGALAARSVGDIAEALKKQAPDPAVERYRALRPTERVQAVLATRPSATAARRGRDATSRAALRRLRRQCDTALRPLDRYVGPAQYEGARVARRAFPRIADALERIRPALAGGLVDRAGGARLLRLLDRAQGAARRRDSTLMVRTLQDAWLVAGRTLVPECHVGSAGRPS